MSLAAPAIAPAESRWDRLGIWASAACTVHCLIAPLLFLALPTFASIWAHPASHALVAVLVLPLAGTVLLKGYTVHGRRWIAAAAVLGMLFIVAGSILPYLETPSPSEPVSSASAAAGAAVEEEAHACTSCCPQIVEEPSGERRLVLPAASIVTVLGSLFLVTSHIGNILACRCCNRD